MTAVMRPLTIAQMLRAAQAIYAQSVVIGQVHEKVAALQSRLVP